MVQTLSVLSTSFGGQTCHRPVQLSHDKAFSERESSDIGTELPVCVLNHYFPYSGVLGRKEGEEAVNNASLCPTSMP